MTHAPSHYTVRETLFQDGRKTLYRATRVADGLAVVLKALDSRHCRPKDVERLRHEYEIGTSLDLRATVRPLAFETHEGMPALVLEDFGGQPLDRLIAGPMATERFLDLAVRIAGAVADLHGQGVVHKDLKPGNILVHPATLEVKLADLGLATRLPREQQAARPPQLIEGSLPYMSPEQTGRMNRAVDSRTDLYSLGVTFYQMLTGRLPFEARDPLEWVHCHVARAPVSPSQLVPELPEPIARIVLKLLAKMADDRYQTARGLQHDLTRCLEQLRHAGRIEPFPLGERDVPDRLQIPQRLYGRDEECSALFHAFERVADTGSPELVLVSGYSGVGKSSLVHELQKPIVRRKGQFIAGKFDQYKRDVPYSTIVQALRELVLDILVEGEERVAAWRQRLQETLGINAQLIVDMIPQVELVIGKQPAVPELPLSEAKSRFHMVFRQFLGAFARKEHPLTLFLDDLQWADSASLELLADILTHPETRHLLAIGAYRDNEVTAAHPLMMTLDGMRKSTLAIRDLVLSPLSREHLGQLVADAMRHSTGEVKPLTSLVEEKTAGNPFFAIQFLTSLHDDGLIRLDPQALAWRCDVASARSKGYTDNVVDLMVAKLRRLPAETQEAVKLAACVGNVADAGTLAVLRKRSDEETHRDLWELVREGLLHRSGDTYRFSHDRVQQAAYALIPEDQRSRTHLTIGRLLLTHTPTEQLSERAFDIVNQLNRGASLIEDRKERYRVAELDLLAGQRAGASTAYGPAAQYLTAGLAMLPAGTWEERYELTFSLHLERARCECLIGSFAEAARCLELALVHARTRADKAVVHRLRIELLTTSGEIERAVDSVLGCTALFGLALERHPPVESVKDQYANVMRFLGSRRIEDLIDLPPMSDPDVRAFVEALVAAAPVTYFFDLYLHFAIISEAVRLSIRYGNAPCSVSVYGSFGALVGRLLGNYQDAYRFGKLGHDLIERGGLAAYKAGNRLTFGYFITVWTRHVRTVLPYLEEGMRAGAETGDLTYACYCCNAIVTVLLARGASLDEVDRESVRLLEFARNARYGDVEDIILTQRRLIHRLRGLTSSPAPAGGPLHEDDGLDRRIQGRLPMALCWYHVRRLQERFLFGDYEEALSEAAKAQETLWASIFMWECCEYSCFLALTLSARCAEASPHDREEFLRMLRAEVEQHRVWAENCPENFLNRHALLSAEMARIEGRELDAERLYEQAIQSAHENGFVQNEALAYELASKFYRARGFGPFAEAYLREARACYLRWGADGKVKQLEQLHPQLLERRPLAPTATFAVRSEQLDLLSVVKASQTISGEILFERLLGTLLKVVLEQGGARRACLIFARDGNLTIEAEAVADESGMTTRLLPSLPLDSSPPTPISLIQYTRLTREPVILDDAASQPGKFLSDPYFVRRRPRSALCLPILRQAELVGLLYLENDLVTSAFTPDRLTALTLLASQAAISVENARLLAQERAARTAAEEAERRAAFLSEAGTLLSESLDWEETLACLGRLCVRSLADWCVIDLLVGREIRRLAGAHADPAKEPLLEQLRRCHPARWDSPHPAAHVLRTGRPFLLSELSEERIRGFCDDDEHARLIRELGTRSVVSVPLLARGQVLAVLSFCSGTPGRYRSVDLELAKELAHRAAIAIDNARLYREAQQAVHLRDEFLSIASHELRTPITSLQLVVQSLERGLLERRSPTFPRMLTLAARQTQRLTALVTQLLDVVRIQSGRLTLMLEEFDLVADVRQILERMQVQIERAKSPVTLHAEEAIVGRWDRSRIDQLLTNLLSNALSYGAGQPIDLTLERVGSNGDGRARVTLRDRGIGIPADRLPHIFERFERATSTRHYGGLGLGLFIARQIAQAHGGTISAESELGRGSSFTVELPLQPLEGSLR